MAIMFNSVSKIMFRRLTWIGLACCVLALAVFTENSRAQSTTDAGMPRQSKQFRILHLVLRGNSPTEAKAVVESAKASGYNAIQFLLTDGVKMDTAPWVPNPKAWSKAQLLEWVAYIRARGLEPIPEIKLLTHQEKFLAEKRPELLFNAVTYDPRKEDVYKVVFPFLDEIVESIRPRIIHIGHDEVVGWNKPHARKMFKPGEVPLPAELFLQDVLRVHGHLRRKDIEVWMWGDTLMAPEEFPDMLARHLHGGLPGYGKVLRDRLPRDIVICDWHYFDEQKEFPSLARLQSEGFRVIAATWKQEETIRNFARYARDKGAYGLMATTWYNMDAPKAGPLVQWIVRASGRFFLDPSAPGIGPAPAVD